MELADDEPTLRQRFLALNCQERVALNVQQLAWVLQATIFAPQGAGKAWVQVVRSGGWGTRLGWRLVAAASSDAAADIERLTPTETAAVAQLGRLGTLHLAARCVPVPEPSLWEIGPSDLSQAQLTAQGAHRVAGLLKSAKGDRVRRLLAVHLVAGLKHSSHPRQKVEALLLGSEGFITGFKRALGFEATPPESVQVLRTLCEGQPRDAVLTIIEEGWSDALLR